MSATPKYSRLDPGQRREQILDAANALFSERGYDEVSVEDIAGSAGVTRGLVHHYFGGRKEVYIALLERLGAQREQQLPPPVGRAPAPAWPTTWPVGLTGPRPTADLARHDRARRGHRRPRHQQWWPGWSAAPPPYSPPTTPTPPSTTRRGCATRSMLDRPQPRRHPPLATRTSHPRADTRTDRLHTRTRP